MSQHAEQVHVPEHKWGDTCPLLKISRHHGFPYEMVLFVADFQIHERAGLLSDYTSVASERSLEWFECLRDIAKVSNRMKAMHMQARIYERDGRLVFQDGSWVVLP